MKVSFMVTYYNQKEYVCQSLDSILAIRKSFDWEILVGDDGSNDGTTDVVNEYIARYPEHISLYVMDREPGKKYEIVRRASANRLNLVQHMTGDYFCFLDGDDRYIDTEFIARGLEVFQAQENCSVVAFGYQYFSQKQGVLSTCMLNPGIVKTSTYLAEGLFVHVGACLLKNCFTPDRVAYLESIGYYDDNNIVINNLHYGSMYAIDLPVYSYLQIDNSTYNAMSFTEQVVLNAQGHDVDRLLLPEQEDALVKRNAVTLLRAIYLRRKLKRLLGQEKWERYLAGCAQIPESLTWLLLNTQRKTPAGEKRIRKTAWSLIAPHPKQGLRVFLQCLKIHP